MYQTLVILLISLTVIMIGCIKIAGKRVIRNQSSGVHLILTAVITTICYTGFILVPLQHYRLAVFMVGLYFLSTDWLVVNLILFTSDYTQTAPVSRIPRCIIFFLAGIDSISFLINTFTNHMYDLHAAAAENFGIEYWDIQFRTLHFVHRLFVYAMVLYCLVIFCYCLVKAPVIYKSKYGSILFQVLAVVGLNIVCSVLNTIFDYSVILYASLAISICYQAFYASPKKLLARINSTIMEDFVVGLFAYDNHGVCVGVNETARELFAENEDIYTTAEKYLSDWRETYKDRHENVIGEERTVVRNNKEKHIYIIYQNFLDEKGRNLGCCFQFEDRTEVVVKYREEQYRATHDILTGLFNRTGFDDEARRILSQAKEPYYMVCSNIQDFKLYNDLYGSDAGDKLLITQANMIRDESDEYSATARIYADKFCTILPQRRFSEPLFVDNMALVMDSCMEDSFRLHYHIGVYEITDPNEPVWTMYDKAMMAIDAIHGNYEEFVSYYRDEMLKRTLEEKEVIGEFANAINEKQFCMYLQPQIANNGKISGAEALVRWIHPKKGMINPGFFIPTLEKAGLIHRLDLFMWGNAAKTLEEWKKQGREDLSISVNISTKDFYYLDVCEAFRVLPKQYDFNIKNLKLEITESALMENAKEIMKTLDRLHALGYDIEIDDFGSGYSSLGMLKDINADILKIDMIFLQETKNADRSQKIIKNIISMSKELGMPVITEGVETKEHVDFLTQAGCDIFQGFYFARPMSLEDFEKEYCK